MLGQVEFVTSSSGLGPLSYVPPHVKDPISWLRDSAPLPKNADELIDRAITEVKVEKLTYVDYFANKRNLREDIPDWLGLMRYTWQKRSKGGNVTMSMDPTPQARGEDFRTDLGEDSLPLFCIKQEFTIEPRRLMAWERHGTPLDVTMVSDSMRAVNEAIEVLGLEGADFPFNGLSVPGLKDAGSKIAFADGLSWTNPSKTGAGMLADVAKAVTTQQINNTDGPYILVIPRTYGNVINSVDYSTSMGNTKTTRQRIMDRDDIADIVSVPRMPADTIALIEPLKSNMDFLVGQTPAVVWWTEGPPQYGIRRYMTIACVVPRFRTTYTGQTGVVVAVPSLS